MLILIILDIMFIKQIFFNINFYSLNLNKNSKMDINSKQVLIYFCFDWSTFKIILNWL